MKDDGSIYSTNTNHSIRTNYNNYKRRIKRVNSKPNISRTAILHLSKESPFQEAYLSYPFQDPLTEHIP